MLVISSMFINHLYSNVGVPLFIIIPYIGKKKTSRNKSHTLPKASSPLPKKQNRKKLPTSPKPTVSSPKKKVANQLKTTVPSPNKKKLTTSQKTTALPKKVTKKDKDKVNLIVPCSFIYLANYE